MRPRTGENTSTILHPFHTNRWRRWTHEFETWVRLKKYWRTKGHQVDERWWTDFKQFLSDVGYAPNTTYRLARTDHRLPWQRGNVAWVSYHRTKAEQRYINAVRAGLIK